jgi:hypothetical protein
MIDTHCHLTYDGLLERVRQGHHGQSPEIHEVILGLNPTLEGDGTTLYLAERLARQMAHHHPNVRLRHRELRILDTLPDSLQPPPVENESQGI